MNETVSSEDFEKIVRFAKERWNDHKDFIESRTPGRRFADIVGGKSVEFAVRNHLRRFGIKCSDPGLDPGADLGDDLVAGKTIQVKSSGCAFAKSLMLRASAYRHDGKYRFGNTSEVIAFGTYDPRSIKRCFVGREPFEVDLVGGIRGEDFFSKCRFFPSGFPFADIEDAVQENWTDEDIANEAAECLEKPNECGSTMKADAYVLPVSMLDPDLVSLCS